MGNFFHTRTIKNRNNWCPKWRDEIFRLKKNLRSHDFIFSLVFFCSYFKVLIIKWFKKCLTPNSWFLNEGNFILWRFLRAIQNANQQKRTLISYSSFEIWNKQWNDRRENHKTPNGNGMLNNFRKWNSTEITRISTNFTNITILRTANNRTDYKQKVTYQSGFVASINTIQLYK